MRNQKFYTKYYFSLLQFLLLLIIFNIRLFSQSTKLYIKSEIDYGYVIIYTNNFEQVKINLRNNSMDTINLESKFYCQIGLSPNLLLKNPAGFLLLPNEKAYLYFDKNGKVRVQISPQNEINKKREQEFNSFKYNNEYRKKLQGLIEKKRINEALLIIENKINVEREKYINLYKIDSFNKYFFYRNNFEKISYASYLIRFKLKENLYNNVISFENDFSALLKNIASHESNFSVGSYNGISLILYDLIYKSKLQKNINTLLSIISESIPKGDFRDRIYMQFFKLSSEQNKIIMRNLLKGLIYSDSSFLVAPQKSLQINELIDTNKKPILFDSLLSSLKGKMSYIDFWASWCAPCIAEFPAMGQLKEKYRDSINFIFISLDKDFNFWAKNIQKFNLSDSKNYLSPSNIFFFKGNKYNISAIPRYILLDKNGEILMLNAPKPSDINIHKLLK